jgi:Fic family protein
LARLEQFIHYETELPLLLRIGLAHAQFETIHPFLDGNGRIGRLLITFLLCEKKVLSHPVLYLSHHFKLHRQSYYDHLQAVRDKGAWEAWLKFFLSGVIEVSRQSTETARQILQLREDHRNAIIENFGQSAADGLRVLEFLYECPIVSVKGIVEFIGKSKQTANKLVARMVDLSILSEFTGQTRNRRFIYQDYIELFRDGDNKASSP